MDPIEQLMEQLEQMGRDAPPYVEQIIFDKDEFEHFLKGDGEYYYRLNTCFQREGKLISKSTLERLYEENGCKTDQEKAEYRDDLITKVFESYDDFLKFLGYETDKRCRYHITYAEVGDKVVMSYAYK